jgi:hypothetical protein
MRRLLLTGDAVGGVWRYSLDLAQGMLARGVSVTLAILGPAPSAAQAEQARAVGLPLVRTGLPLDWTAPDAQALRAAAAELAGLAHRLRVDRVHLHTPALAAHAPWSVPVVAVAHSDIGSWWEAVRGGRPAPEFAWNVEAVGHGLAEADAVIAPTHAFAATLDRLYRPGRPIEVVHNGVVPAPIAAGHVRERRVLAAGRLWDEAKNAEVLSAIGAGLEVPVLAAGPLRGPNGASVCLSGIVCPGELSSEALAAEMARASVFISAARYEPFGLAVLEAARAGMALALSDIPTHRELWDGAALFFHPLDAAAARDVLRRLLRSPEEFARRAMQRAERYTAEAMVERTLAIHRGPRLRHVA